MKAIACLIILCAIVPFDLNGQTPLPSAGPTFSTRDTSRADVLSVASLQVYPVGIDKIGNETEKDSSLTKASVPVSKPLGDTGPIRDWSNPPGYMGASSPPTAMVKHKPLTPGKYHRKRLRRCYTF